MQREIVILSGTPGHPIGATGALITVNKLKRANGHFALNSCRQSRKTTSGITRARPQRDRADFKVRRAADRE
ncbi:hypothetical protein, partial [Caballeronia glathei]